MKNIQTIRALQKQREYIRVEPRGKWHAISPYDMKTVCGVRLQWGKVQAVTTVLPLRFCSSCLDSFRKLDAQQRPKNVTRIGYYEMFEQAERRNVGRCR